MQRQIFLTFYLLLTVSAFYKSGLSFPEFQAAVPNGYKVPHPCNGSIIWPGIGHELPSGSGALNSFGKDFLANDKQWSINLCQADSDGDGRTNGEELGDPNCLWMPNVVPFVTVTKLSHPGICEPVNAPVCIGKNQFLVGKDGCDVPAVKQRAINPDSQWCPEVGEQDVQEISLVFDEFSLPAGERFHYCQQFDLPSDADYHIIAWTPVISNTTLVHHMVLYICDTPEQQFSLDRSGAYVQPSQCSVVPKECISKSIVWAVGAPSRCYDNATGVPMGKSHFSKVILQIRYQNPTGFDTLVDGAGLKLYYTAQKRQYDIASVMVGQFDIAVPPQSSKVARVMGKSFQSTNCSLQQLAPYSSYNLSSVLFLMNKLGVHAKLTLKKRNGRFIPIIDEQVSYDNPKSVIWSTGNSVVLEPGDNIEIECGYRSLDRDSWTYFGENSTDEVCIAYFDIYPRPQNLNSLNFVNLGKLDACALNNSEVDGCILASFQTNLTLWEGSHIGGLMTYCNDPELGYPAFSCSYTCYTFLSKKGLLDHPCMRTPIFHLAATNFLSEEIDDIYRIRSQAERCMALNKPPQMSAKDKLFEEVILTAEEVMEIRSSKSSALNKASHGLYLSAAIFAMIGSRFREGHTG